MAERALIMTGHSVLASMKGTKTQTRRVLTERNSEPGAYDWNHPEVTHDFDNAYVDPGFPDIDGEYTFSYLKTPMVGDDRYEGVVDRVWPRVELGDVFWVREAHAIREHEDWEEPVTDENGEWQDGYTYRWEEVYYRATPRVGRRRWLTDPLPGQEEPHHIRYLHESSPLEQGPVAHIDRWRSPIHMPKWACRLRIEVVAVRPERLQEITPTSCIAEGLRREPALNERGHLALDGNGYRAEFAALWDTINAKRGDGWATNPWIWVYTYRRLEA